MFNDDMPRAPKAWGAPLKQQPSGSSTPRLFNTDFFSLGYIFRQRMQTYTCQVSDPMEADLFYVPYYAGWDAWRPPPGKCSASQHLLDALNKIKVPDTDTSFVQRHRGQVGVECMGWRGEVGMPVYI